MPALQASLLLLLQVNTVAAKPAFVVVTVAGFLTVAGIPAVAQVTSVPFASLLPAIALLLMYLLLHCPNCGR
jgi:hypothetical protein